MLNVIVDVLEYVGVSVEVIEKVLEGDDDVVE